MTGLSPWEPVELSRDTDAPIIDLSVLDFADDANETTPEAPQAEDDHEATPGPVPGGAAADHTQEEQDTMPDTPEGGGGFSDADIQKMRAMLEAWDAQAEAPAEETEPEFTEEELRQAAYDFLGLTEQPNDDDESGDDSDTTEQEQEPAEEREPVSVGLSYEAQRSIDLANSRADRVEIQLAQITRERDEERFQGLVKSWAEDYGIPPRITELAKPLLCGQAPAIELSNGDTADAGQIVRDVVTELAKARYLDLSRDDTVYDETAAARETEEATSRRDRAKAHIANAGI